MDENNQLLTLKIYSDLILRSNSIESQQQKYISKLLGLFCISLLLSFFIFKSHMIYSNKLLWLCIVDINSFIMTFSFWYPDIIRQF